MTDGVVDASVGVMWFVEQAGSVAASALLRRATEEDIILWIDRHCLVEILAVAARRSGTPEAREAWTIMLDAGVRFVDVDDDLLEDALVESAILGCALYDAIPAALARRLGAPLYSADRRAHAGCEGAVIIG
jgi:predicted nucleic acid-binding protein